MEEVFSNYWWLLFPLAFFVFGAWDRWLSYQRSKDHLDLLRSYTSQGKDPPPELIKALREEDDQDEPTAYGDYNRYGGRHARRAYRRYYRHGPVWAWRRAIVTGSVAAGFWFAAIYADLPGVDWSFKLVAIIMSCVAVGNLVAAVFSSTFRGR